MKLHLICYDFHIDRNYSPLWDKLRQMRAVRLQKSVWFLESEFSAEELKVIVCSMIDRDDTVAVVELKPGSGWATINVNARANEWLSEHMCHSAPSLAKTVLGYGPAFPIAG